MTDPVARLKEWFDNKARPFLEQHETDKVVELDQDLDNHYDPVTVVRAPTGGGKTIVFFVNAAMSSLCGPERSTSILMFPTRLVNDDMFRRLIACVAKLRANLPNEDVTGGILMGTSDPLYKLLLEPQPGEPMYHYGP